MLKEYKNILTQMQNIDQNGTYSEVITDIKNGDSELIIELNHSIEVLELWIEDSNDIKTIKSLNKMIDNLKSIKLNYENYMK